MQLILVTHALVTYTLLKFPILLFIFIQIGILHLHAQSSYDRDDWLYTNIHIHPGS